MDKRISPDAQPFADTSSIESVREGQSRFGRRVGRAGRKSSVSWDGVVGVCYEPTERTVPGTAIYLHGGGFVSGDGLYAQGVAALLSAKLGLRLCLVPYRLAPETPYPGALDDAQKAYQQIWESGEEPLFFLGDSSGGGLCFSLALRLKKLGWPQPRGIAALSPWVDLTLSSLSDQDSDGLMDTPLLRSWAELYAGGVPLTNPELSPLLGDLSGLPPCLLFAGGDELMCGDLRRLQKRLEAFGVAATLHVAPGCGHTYPLFGGREARMAIEQMHAFFQSLT